MSEWPAMKKWADLNYLKRVAGKRTVPIEIGSNYLSDDWGQQLMPFEKFLDEYIQHPCSTTGYLAQHPLFEQIQPLRNDVIVPDYCALYDDTNAPASVDGVVNVNAWFGPANTISPLHYDPGHNLLCQVVGKKYIRIYDPSESSKLYPVEEGMCSNTSQVSVEDPQPELFPEFESAVYTECILSPGEMLYIPPTYWHYVRSLDISFSVSTWW